MGLMDKFADPALIDSLSFGEKMAGSAITMLMGMGVTFLVLCLLWLFIAIMGRVMDSVKKGDKAQAAVTSASASAAPASSAAPDDEVIAAVIAAAIAAYQGSGGTGNLIVRKISRLSDETTLWSSAAREECMESRKL